MNASKISTNVSKSIKQRVAVLLTSAEVKANPYTLSIS